VSIVRSEETAAAQAETVISFAGSLPLVWVGTDFSDAVRTWARERLPMTLLVQAGDSLPDEERGRIARFLALLARQTEYRAAGRWARQPYSWRCVPSSGLTPTRPTRIWLRCGSRPCLDVRCNGARLPSPIPERRAHVLRVGGAHALCPPAPG